MLNKIKQSLPFTDAIMTGPIVGAVEENSVRILIEFKNGGEKELSLVGNETLKQTLEVEPKRPYVFKFSNLKQGCQYQIQYDGNNIGKFNTPQDGKQEFNFGVISCNAIEYTQKQKESQQLWRDLEKKVKENKIDFILHIGDQIYTDLGYWDGDRKNIFAKIEEMVKDTPVDQLSQYTEEARELVRQQYRDTWNYGPTQFCLANCSSRMILDDHEIVDDAGKNPELQDPNNWKYWFSQQVTRYVYYEYEKQLIEDINFENLNLQTQEFFTFKYQKSGFFIQDNRGHFLWHGDKPVKEESYFGKNQLKAFKEAFSSNGQFKDCTSVFLISPMPLVLFSERIIQFAYETMKKALGYDDFGQHIMFDHKKELIEILEILRSWKESKANRVITLIGGDLHMGAHHEIYYKNQPFCKQLITSSIANSPMKKYQGLVAEIAGELEENIGDGYSFEKHDFQFQNNYGLINVKDNGQNQIITMSLVNNEKGFNDGKQFNNVNFKKSGSKSCSCSIF